MVVLAAVSREWCHGGGVLVEVVRCAGPRRGRDAGLEGELSLSRVALEVAGEADP